MRLVSITVENYRSITKAHKIRLGSMTTLVGPNNEGKSNILRALVVAMSVLTGERFQATIRGAERRFTLRYALRGEYEWERDFPLHLQVATPTGESRILLEFDLAPDEITQFRDEIGSVLNGTLPLRIALGPRGHYTVAVAKPGRGGKTLTAKSPQIAAFVAE